LREAELGALADEVRLARSLLGRLPGELSGGQRQRVALVRALAAEPAILVADEITSALDRDLGFEVVDLLRARVERGLGLVFVTHDLALLPGLVDEVVVMAAGRVVEAGPTAQVVGAPRSAVARALRDAMPRLPSAG
ncbi:MAG TPA: ABC transporter ATP-binding protein, partial [Nannocystaceae bacterium]|nr:ABC transporter ATP-binding protein [Nannocystaceae bacterium]